MLPQVPRPVCGFGLLWGCWSDGKQGAEGLGEVDVQAVNLMFFFLISSAKAIIIYASINDLGQSPNLLPTLDFITLLHCCQVDCHIMLSHGCFDSPVLDYE